MAAICILLPEMVLMRIRTLKGQLRFLRNTLIATILTYRLYVYVNIQKLRGL